MIPTSDDGDEGRDDTPDRSESQVSSFGDIQDELERLDEELRGLQGSDPDSERLDDVDQAIDRLEERVVADDATESASQPDPESNPVQAGLQTLQTLKQEYDQRGQEPESTPEPDATEPPPSTEPDEEFDRAERNVQEVQDQLSTLSELVGSWQQEIARPSQGEQLEAIQHEEPQSLREQREQEKEAKRADEGAARHAKTKRRLIRLGLVLAAATVVSPLISALTPVQPYAVASRSMEPGIPKGSLVVAEPGQPDVGDVVVYKSAIGPYQIHRVKDVQDTGETTYYTTQGDNNEGPDAFSVPEKDIRGVVQHSVPHLGKLWLMPMEIQAAAFLTLVGAYLAVTFLDDRVLFKRMAKKVAVLPLAGAMLIPAGGAMVQSTMPASTQTGNVNQDTPFPLEPGIWGDHQITDLNNTAETSVKAPTLQKTTQVWGCDPSDTSDAGCTLDTMGTSYGTVTGTQFMPRQNWQPTSSLTFRLEAYMKASSGETTSARLYDVANNDAVRDSEVRTSSTSYELVRSGAIDPGTDMQLGAEHQLQVKATTADSGAIRMVRLVAELRYDWSGDQDIAKVTTQVPISGGDLESGGGGGQPSERGGRFEYNTSMFPKDGTLSKVEFEAVGFTDSNGGADILLQDLTAGSTVATISYQNGDPVTRKIADVTANMADGHVYEVQLDRGGGGGSIAVYNARIIVQQQSLAQKADWATGRYVDLTWANSTTSTSYQPIGHPGVYEIDEAFDNDTAHLVSTIGNDNNNALTSLRLLGPGGEVLAHTNRSANSFARVQSDGFTMNQSANRTYDAELKAGSGTARVRKAWIALQQAPGRLWDHSLETLHDGVDCTWAFWLEYDGDPSSAVDGESLLDNATVYLANASASKPQLVVEGNNGPARKELSHRVRVAPGETLEHRVRYDANPASTSSTGQISADLHGECIDSGVHTVQNVDYKFDGASVDTT